MGGGPPVHILTNNQDSKSQRQIRERRAAKVPESAYEKELKQRLQDVEERLHIKEGKGGCTTSVFNGSLKQQNELEEEYHSLRKIIKQERATAIQCYVAAMEVAADQTSWAERVLDQGRFDQDKTATNSLSFTAETAGLMTKEQYAQKRKESEHPTRYENQHVEDSFKEPVEILTKRKAKDTAKKRAKAASMLSFNQDDEDVEGS